MKKSDLQALAFVEPHGMVRWDSLRVQLLEDIRSLELSIPIIGLIVTPTRLDNIQIPEVMPSERAEYLRSHHIVLQEGNYIRDILEELRQKLDAARPQAREAERGTDRFRIIEVGLIDAEEIPDDRRYLDYVPFYSLKAAAGTFGPGEDVGIVGWLRVEGPLTDAHFASRAVGRSMEPTIQGGDLLLFRRYSGGSRQGKVVLAQWSGPADPETGGSYAVKRYQRLGEREEGGVTIELQSDNGEYGPIVLSGEHEDEVEVIAELVQVLSLK